MRDTRSRPRPSRPPTHARNNLSSAAREKSLETLGVEFYLHDELQRAGEIRPHVPVDIKTGTVMQQVWNIACDMGARYGARTIEDIAGVYALAHQKTGEPVDISSG